MTIESIATLLSGGTVAARTTVSRLRPCASRAGARAVRRSLGPAVSRRLLRASIRVLGCIVGLLVPSGARAGALAPAAADPAREAGAPAVFAIVVTNNRSTNLERPDLQYADDDGARYLQLFRGVAAAGAVRLLTRFDRATAAAHPELLRDTRPPRRADLLAALATLGSEVAEARRAGKRTAFYFVFAGHGDVESGVGYLDLEDGRIDAPFLEREVVDRVGADVEHIVLDSCNSFFVVNPRKPGGRRWATPRDLTLGFARRHPNVGLFLSTNSEAEVYEWSELESGIFSHEVRSGLSGAADVDGDGQVSYAELAGFVDRANAKLPRANLRPQVFQRGPDGESRAPLFLPAHAEGRRIVVGAAERRLWIRGAAAERLIDLHKEQGPMTVVVPGPLDQPLAIVEWRHRAAAARVDDRPMMIEYEVPGGTNQVLLDELVARAVDSAARGGGAMFGELFKEPYGARAFDAFLDEQAHAPDPVFGIGLADENRMRNYLTFIADSDREVGRSAAFTLGTFGVVLGGVGVGLILTEPRSADRDLNRVADGALAGLGLVLLGAGVRRGIIPQPGELALAAFEAELRATPDNRPAAVAKTEILLDELARRDRREMRLTIGLFAGTAALVAAATSVSLADAAFRRDAGGVAAAYGLAAALGFAAWRISDRELPTQRMLRLYRSDPDLALHVGFAPIPGGGGLSLSGGY